MASSFGVFCTLIMVGLFVFMMNAPTLEASNNQFKVGDELGWLEPGKNNSAIYNQWAGRNRFQVGDSLIFEYKNDSVLVVEKWGYYHCDQSKPIIAFNNGNSSVKLDRPGLFYFISGATDHCKNGQRMIVDVMSPHPPSPLSPSPAAAPGPYFPLSPSPAQSSGVLVSVTCGSLLVALVATVATLLV